MYQKKTHLHIKYTKSENLHKLEESGLGYKVTAGRPNLCK